MRLQPSLPSLAPLQAPLQAPPGPPASCAMTAKPAKTAPVPPSRRQALGLALAGLAGWAAPAGAAAPGLPAIGSTLALPAEVPLLDGRRFTPGDAQGRVLVLYWWASWCPFCALQSPHVDALWRAHQARGLGVLGLSIDRSADEARRYMVQRGHAFPSAWVTPALAAALPKPPGLPVTVVLGRDGRVRAAESGQLFPEDIAQFAAFL